MPPPNRTRLYDLPDVILSNIFLLISDVRSRNSAALVSRKFLLLERSTRTSLTLRGNLRDLFLIPPCFRSVTHLDLSLLSPWGHSLFDSSSQQDPRFLALFLAHLFPSIHSLTLYARSPDTLRLLAPHWPDLRRVKLVRWHQRSPSPPLGSDFVSLFQHCNSLESLDLSHFYCWTEDLPPALQAHPLVSGSISHLDLLTLSSAEGSSAEGFKSQELIAITGCCRNLKKLLAVCMFDPRYIDFVGDEALLAVAANCGKLELLHLADTSALSILRGDLDDDGFTSEDARIGRGTFEDLFSGLPFLEELVLDVGHNVRDSGSVLELLNSKCPRLKSLKLGQFHGICSGITSQLDGIALCRRLECLSIKNCGDLTDNALMAIALGCPRISKFEVRGCKKITEMGIRNLTCVLSKTLVDVNISCCKNLDAAATLRGLELIRPRIQTLHMDFVWGRITNNYDLNNKVKEEQEEEEIPIASKMYKTSNFNETDKKEKTENSSCNSSNSSDLELKTWDRLQYLSLWVAVGDLLTPLPLIGLENCPVLEEVRIRVEGDCRGRPSPRDRAFGLSCLSRYPRLSKMQLDCREVVGYSLTAPPGQMDLSLWDRFYLQGIGDLRLNEIDYWPTQDREVNQRSLTLPAAGLLAQCTTLRKLFIHGTAHEHFMLMLLKIPNLRDVQLREDYYPAPEDDMSTEMRATSCCRFEDALNRRIIPD